MELHGIQTREGVMDWRVSDDLLHNGTVSFLFVPEAGGIH